MKYYLDVFDKEEAEHREVVSENLSPARVMVRQIKEADFKKRKYQAMSKRDECTDGIITPEEFTEWMENSFGKSKTKNLMGAKNPSHVNLSKFNIGGISSYI